MKKKKEKRQRRHKQGERERGPWPPFAKKTDGAISRVSAKPFGTLYESERS